MRCIFNLIASVVLAILLVVAVQIIGEGIYPTPGGMETATAESGKDKAESGKDKAASAEDKGQTGETAQAEDAGDAGGDTAQGGDTGDTETADAGGGETGDGEAGGDESFADKVAAASASEGKNKITQCRACHTFKKGGGNRVGPNLYNVAGNAVASKEDFNYSDALKNVGGDWTVEKLGSYLKNPSGFAPGNKMTFGGLKDADNRAAVVAYLQSLTD